MNPRLIYPFFIVALVAYVGLGAKLFQLSAADERDDPYQQLELFTRVLERVRKDYVDGENLTYKDLIQGAMKGMLSTLDPHSEFMTVSKFNELKEDTEGTYGGVGLQVHVKDGLLTVIAPMAIQAGQLATTAMLMESQGLQFLHDTELPFIAVDATGAVHTHQDRCTTPAMQPS